MRVLMVLFAISATLLAGCANRPVSAPVVDISPPRAAPPPAPAPARPAPQAAAPEVPATYAVRRGDTLYSIALEHGLDYRDLTQWNRLNDPSRIREGQSLSLRAQDQASDHPAVALGSVNRPASIDARPLEGTQPGTQQGSAAPAQAGIPVKSEPKALRLPYTRENLASLAKEEPATLPKPAPVLVKVDPQPAKAEPHTEGVSFVWPAKGRVISAFSESTNKGLDIEGKAGDPVFAAATGRVMYTGTGIRGYGKLIVIKHEDGYNSVYAHNREILVKEGQSVTRGERIAELGDSDADRPKLHFEIRKSGKPVDPMKHLEPR